MSLLIERTPRISMAIFFFVIIFFPVSIGTEEEGFKISDSLTLHSGDIITLQATDNRYLTMKNMISCLYKISPFPIASSIKERRNVLQLTPYAEPDGNDSAFTVEIAEKNQILLRESKHGLYLGTYDIKPNSKSVCISGPHILANDTDAGEPNIFKVGIITRDDNKIVLQASNGYFLQYNTTYRFRYNCNFLSVLDMIPIVETDYGCKLAEYNLVLPSGRNPRNPLSHFTVERTGIDPNYVQSISDVEFNTEMLKLPGERLVIMEFEPQENPGTGELFFTINDEYTKTTIDKWTWEKGTELAAGLTLKGSLKIPEIGEAGTEVSTTIKSSTKDTNEQTQEEQHKISWNERIQIPPYKRVGAKVIASESKVEVPFTANVTVMSKDGTHKYTYPISGTYQGSLYYNVNVELTIESLNQTLAIKPTVSQFAKQQTTVADINMTEASISKPTGAVTVTSGNSTTIYTYPDTYNYPKNGTSNETISLVPT